MKTAVRAVTYCKFSETREASTMSEKPCNKCNFKPVCSRVISSPSGWRLLRNTYHVAKALAFVRFREEVTEKDVRDALFASLFYKVKLNTDLLGVHDEVSAMIKFVDVLFNDVTEAWEILRQVYDANTYDEAYEKYISTLIYEKPIPQPVREMLITKPYMEDVIIGLKDTLNERASKYLFDAYFELSRGNIDKALELFSKARIILRRRLYPFEYELEKLLIRKVDNNEISNPEVIYAYRLIKGVT